MVNESGNDVLRFLQSVMLRRLGVDSVMRQRDIVPRVDLDSLLNDCTLEERTAESLDVLQRVLALCAGQRLKELCAHERLIPLQRCLAEVSFEMLVPNLCVPAYGRRFLPSLACELYDLFAVGQVSLFPEIRDGHVLLSFAVRLTTVTRLHNFASDIAATLLP